MQIILATTASCEDSGRYFFIVTFRYYTKTFQKFLTSKLGNDIIILQSKLVRR